MNLRNTFLFAVITGTFVSIVSCTEVPSAREIHDVDSLNAVSYNLRYTDIKVSALTAIKAYRTCFRYDRGKAEACNNLAFCFYIRMNFNRAEQLYCKVGDLSKNQIEQLIADIGLMRIYQRTAKNESFYEMRNDAKKRMKRIDQDSYVYMSPHNVRRLNYAYSDFNIASAIYYYYLRQHAEAVSSLNAIDPKWLAGDSCQWMYYHYVRGWAAIYQGPTHDEKMIDGFDELYTTWETASRHRAVYFVANALQSMSDMLASGDSYRFLIERRGYRLNELGLPLDTLLSLHLAQRSLYMFRRYGDPYQIAGSYVSIAQYNNIHGRYADAYRILVQALNDVNAHHRRYYPFRKKSDELVPYAPYDTISREIRWISTEKAKTVPEWISSIREQLSVAYAGMGNKLASDYNRNAYLDILNYTRQDKELETRYNSLQAELKTLNALFLVTLAGTAVLIFLLWIFNKYARIRDRRHTLRLRRALSECRRITTYTSEQAVARLQELQSTAEKSKEDRAMVRVLMPYVSWVIENRKTVLMLTEEHERLEKERYLSRQHIIENKRQNIVKKACLSIVNGINPYIDRIVNEIHKLQSPEFNNEPSVRKERLQYVDELVTTINDYNGILTQWIKMKQGTISLNIESFSLNDLFDILEKGRRTFEMKRQHLIVDKTDAVVKADKALTLFMINTLSENARKYTPEGGTVHISARSTDRYVEISVEDTGRGLSSEDIRRILGEKVYDSKQIGIRDGNDVETLRKNKGGGFGLMNCKGIIEKYRKTDAFFDVCLFDIESTIGKGSRFFFRIPKGVRRTLMFLLCLFLPFTFQSCHHEDEMKERNASIDSIARIEKQPGFENLLDRASHYADMTYYSNVDHHYRQALLYADSAVACLNAHYRKYARHPKYFMQLTGTGTPAEIEWWNRLYDSDFHIILDIRNESAVAFLALKQLDDYQYNNDAYTSLYKLLGEDKSLAEYCRHLQRSATDKTVELTICILLILIAAVAYYFLFVRKRVINRMNLEQVFAINEIILKASLQPVSESRKDSLKNVEDTMTDIPRNIVNASFDAINELVPVERIGLAVYSSILKAPAFVCNPPSEKMPPDIQRCYDTRMVQSAGNQEMFPLLVDTVDGQRCVGVLYLEIREGIELGTDRLLVQLVAEYMAIVVLHSILRPASDYHDIESAHEEINKSSYEDSQLHVQNMVLDNCLSTIKHETVYYPNKIKQIVTRLDKEENTPETEKENIRAIGELIEYYRGIYTILDSCATRQLEEVTFRRTDISADALVDYASAYFKKKNKRDTKLSLETHSVPAFVAGDIVLLQFLLENLIDESLRSDTDGRLILRATEEDEFVRFDYIDTRRTLRVEELNRLFYPRIDRMDYLICRQIIREHDEYAGHRGCRINAGPYYDGNASSIPAGYTVYFTLTKNKKRYGRKKI